jgi:predicted Rossmann fold flavoprotein
MAATTDDLLVLGGGAAGLFCALTAGQRGRRVRVIEHANRVGKKILMSGGGRCNFTNTGTTPANYLSANPHFAKSALARYRPADFIAMVERHGIAYHEKELGQLFCDESSKLIVRMLVDECASANVLIETDCAIEAVTHDNGSFAVTTSRGRYSAPSLAVATGGLSIPKMGATGIGYRIAQQFGHAVLPTRAGLVPLTLSGAPLDDWAPLAGLAAPVEARANGTAFRGAALVTHRGFSGPALLQVSSYWQAGEPLILDWLPDRDAADWLAAEALTRPQVGLVSLLADLLPKRLAVHLAERLAPPGPAGLRPLRQWKAAEVRALGSRLNGWTLPASGTEGYRTAEVTLGGVDTAGLDSKTMASKHLPGLHFIGEVVDVTGWLGGYNFQWAWASGHAAGLAV